MCRCTALHEGKRDGERRLETAPAWPGAGRPPQDRMDGLALRRRRSRRATAPRPYAPASFFILATVAPLMLWPASTDT